MKLGVLFVGHGTRSKVGLREFERFVASVTNQINQNPLIADEFQTGTGRALWFGSCFLELQEPTVLQGIEAAVLNGCVKVIVVPIFLFSANHIKSDIPRLLEIARHRYSELSIIQTNPFGPDESLVHVCSYRLIESGWIPGVQGSCIVLVGRGGHDAQARLQFESLSAKLAIHLKISSSTIKHAFLAGEGPSVSEALAQCIREGTRNVYVVPVLLFHGMLISELGRQVRSLNQQTMWNGMTAILVDHVQNHVALVHQLADKVTSTIISVPVVQ